MMLPNWRPSEAPWSKPMSAGTTWGIGRLVEDRMRLANCRRCCGLAWIVRLSGEETWRAGGSALNGHCEERGS